MTEGISGCFKDNEDVEKEGVEGVTPEPEKKEEEAPEEISVMDLSEFMEDPPITREGEFKFSIDSEELRKAALVVKSTAGGSNPAFSNVKLSVLSNRVKLTSCNQVTFSEKVCALEENEASVPFSFVLDGTLLTKLVNNFKGIMNFELKAKQNLLTVKSGQSSLDLTTKGSFIHFKVKLKDLKYLWAGKAPIFHEGVTYINQFAEKNDLFPALSLVELVDAQLVGGSQRCVGIFDTPAFQDRKMRVRYEAISAFEKYLAGLGDTTVQVFEAGTYYIWAVQDLYFGMEKTPHHFPPLSSFFNAERLPDTVSAPKKELTEALNRLAVVVQNKDREAVFSVEGGEDAMLRIDMMLPSGRKATDCVAVSRYVEDGGPVPDEKRMFKLVFTDFLRVVRGCSSPDILLREVKDISILVEDQKPGSKTIAILSMSGK